MDPNDWAKFILILAIVVIPVLAVTVIITSRLALRPIIDAVLRLREGMDNTRSAQTAADTQRLALVEDELHQLRGEMRELRETVEFHARLQAGQSGQAVGSQAVRSAGRPTLHVEAPAPAQLPPVEDAGDFAQEYE